MIEAVIFDIDGTLLDSVDLHAQAWQEAFRHFGYEIPFADIRSQIGKGGDQLLPVFLSEQELKAKSPMARTLFVTGTYGDSKATFAPTDDAYGQNTYEVLGSLAKPGCAQTALEKAGVDLLTKYADNGFAAR